MEDEDHRRGTWADRRAFWQAEALAAVLIESSKRRGVILARDDAMVRAVRAVRWWGDEGPMTPAQMWL